MLGAGDFFAACFLSKLCREPHLLESKISEWLEYSHLKTTEMIGRRQ